MADFYLASWILRRRLFRKNKYTTRIPGMGQHQPSHTEFVWPIPGMLDSTVIFAEQPNRTVLHIGLR